MPFTNTDDFSRIQDSILAPAMNPDASKLILMNFPYKDKVKQYKIKHCPHPTGCKKCTQVTN